MSHTNFVTPPMPFQPTVDPSAKVAHVAVCNADVYKRQEVKALVLISSSHTPFMIDDDSMILELFSWIYRFSLQPNGVDLKTGDRLAGFMKLLAQHSPDVVNPEFVNKLFAENFSLDDTQWPELSRKAYAIAREESLAFGEDRCV